MKYHHNSNGLVARFKTNMKKFAYGAIAVIIATAGVSIPASAIGPDEAEGNVGYTAYGLQRNARFDVEQESNKCTTKWNVEGNYSIAFNLNGDPTQYVHDLTLNQNGNSLKGLGGYPAGGPHIYEWKLKSGTVNGSNVNFVAKYTLGADAVTPLTTMTVTGTIAPNGTMSGTWADNYQGGNRAGQWTTTSGAATQLVAGCQGEGVFRYSDVNGTQYRVNVKFVKVSGNDAWFAGPVTSGNAGLGQWLFAKVHDGGTPGSNGDQVSGSFTTKDAAKLAVALMSNPGDGPFAVTSGNLRVH